MLWSTRKVWLALSGLLGLSVIWQTYAASLYDVNWTSALDPKFAQYDSRYAWTWTVDPDNSWVVKWNTGIDHLDLDTYVIPPHTIPDGTRIDKKVVYPNAPKLNQIVWGCTLWVDTSEDWLVHTGRCMTVTTDTTFQGLPYDILQQWKIPAFEYTNVKQKYSIIDLDKTIPTTPTFTLPSTLIGTGGVSPINLTASDEKWIAIYHYSWNDPTRFEHVDNFTTGWVRGNLARWSKTINPGESTVSPYIVTKKDLMSPYETIPASAGVQTLYIWSLDNYGNISDNPGSQKILYLPNGVGTLTNTSKDKVGIGTDVQIKPIIEASLSWAVTWVSYKTSIINNTTGNVDPRFTCNDFTGTQTWSILNITCPSNVDFTPGEKLDYSIVSTPSNTLDNSTIGTPLTATWTLTVINTTTNTIKPLLDASITDTNVNNSGSWTFILKQDSRADVNFSNPNIKCENFTKDLVTLQTPKLIDRKCTFTNFPIWQSTTFTYTQTLTDQWKVIETKDYKHTIVVPTPTTTSTNGAYIKPDYISSWTITTPTVTTPTTVNLTNTWVTTNTGTVITSTGVIDEPLGNIRPDIDNTIDDTITQTWIVDDTPSTTIVDNKDWTYTATVNTNTKTGVQTELLVVLSILLITGSVVVYKRSHS